MVNYTLSHQGGQLECQLPVVPSGQSLDPTTAGNTTDLLMLWPEWCLALDAVNGPSCDDAKVDRLFALETAMERTETSTPLRLAMRLRVLSRQAAVAYDDGGLDFGEMERLADELISALSAP